MSSNRNAQAGACAFFSMGTNKTTSSEHCSESDNHDGAILDGTYGSPKLGGLVGRLSLGFPLLQFGGSYSSACLFELSHVKLPYCKPMYTCGLFFDDRSRGSSIGRIMSCVPVALSMR